MVHSRIPVPIAREMSWPGAFAVGYSQSPVLGSPETQAASVLTSLRKQIDAGASEFSAIVNGIAKEAQSLTNATGAAIALGHRDSVVCVGRSGETAPDLGAQLSVNSGFSGECLSSRKTLRCDDTQMDHRVDSEVCLRLGLRSIVAVPIHGEFGRIGVLEAFSIYPFVFSDAHVQLLEKLAELVTMAQERQGGPDPALQQAAVAMASFEPALGENVSIPPQYTPVERLRHFLATQEQPPRRLVGVALATVVVVSALAWTALHRPAKGASASAVPAAEVASTASSTPAAPMVSMEFSTKPTPIKMAISVASKRTVDRHTSPAENDDAQDDVTVVRDLSGSPSQGVQESRQAVPDTVVSAADAPSRASSAESTVDPPEIADLRSSAGSPDLQNLMPAPAAPKLAATISQGVVRGTLVHRVEPIYPPQAHSMGLSGAVVLDAAVSDTGVVQDVTVVSGHPVLAQAATNAVRQWRYSPWLLNGKPVKVRTMITVNFAP